MTFENILTEIKEGILTLTINRADKLNALNKKTIEEIGVAVANAQKDSAVKVIIITGAGSKAFVAGADISEFAGFNTAQGAALAKHGHDVFNRIEQSVKPVIAAINGFALGGGCELAMACHIRIASDNARFGQPEVKLGLIPGYGGTQRLTRLIGQTKSLELLITAEMISAEVALRYNLLNYITTPELLMQTCIELAKKIMQQAPLAIAAIIRCVNASQNPAMNGFDTEIQEFGTCFNTADVKEGTQAFIEKRKAEFKGA